MPYRWRNALGFTGVELMIAVVAIGIIGGSVASARLHMLRRAIERVVASDLDAYAQAQMSARGERGRFATHAEMLAGGFGWSDDVETGEVRTADDRFFVRVRHTRTGYSCALDFSPVTGTARNRKVCRASAADPALAVPPGITVTRPRGDTVSVVRPPAPPTVDERYLLPPEVGDADEVVLAPGASRVVAFPVANRSAEPRTFAFAASSADPGLVPDPGRPADARLNAGEAAPIPVTVSVAAGSLADVATEVELRASDTGDRAYTGSGVVRVRAALVLASPSVTAPAAEVRDPGETFTVEYLVRNRSNAARVLRLVAEIPAGSALSLASPLGEQTFGAFEERAVPVTYRLDPEVDGGTDWSTRLAIADRDAPEYAQASGPVVITARLVLASPTLTVPETPPAVAWMAGRERTLKYPAVNRSNAARELCLVVEPRGPQLTASLTAPPCVMVAARASHVFRHALRGTEAGETEVAVTVYDRAAPRYEARGRFDARVVSARPVALWTAPSPVYARKWADFDASRSFSPAGARIVKYVWSWGLFNQRWTGWRFEAGGTGVATDELTTPTARRAWDFRGTFQVCLAVEDEVGFRSDPSCAAVTIQAETRARLAFRYRGWWYEPSDFCLDVPWDDQCPKENGNARWEILLNQSQGDVPIKRAWATLRVDYWQTDDEFERAHLYGGNMQPPPYASISGGRTVTYDFFTDGPQATGSIEGGRWRVLDTNGSAAFGWPRAPELHRHPLVLNADLGSATGAFDGGPHWVPDDAWITLFVEDAQGTVTQQSAYLDHERSAWRGGECINGTSGLNCIRGYERLTPPSDPPVVSLSRVDLGNYAYRFTGSGSSPDGRIVDRWWEITSTPFDPAQGAARTSIQRGDSLELSPDHCTTVDVALVYVDDRGVQGRAVGEVSRGDARSCSGGAPT